MAEHIFKNNPQSQRYELHVDGNIAIAKYVIRNDEVYMMTHTEVPPELEGQGIGSELIKKSLEDIRDQGRHVYPICPFVVAYIEKHPEWRSLVK